MCSKLRCTEEKALHASIKSEKSKRIYNKIKEVLGKQPSSLTQVDIIDSQVLSGNTRTTLTSREDIEHTIMHRN
jgi:uncharacterized protein YbcI